MEATVREVWASNLMEELPLILEARESFPYVALDTEFPGFLHQTPRFASPEHRYRDVKHNVDRMKLIQVGLTFFGFGDGGGGRRRRLTWQINLREFDVSCPTDARWEPSVELLRRSGVDLEKTRKDGVDSGFLSELMLGSGWMTSGDFGRRPSWVTFQGFYDIAYLVKLLTRSSPLPETLPAFVQLAGETLGSVFDAKHVARFCGSLRGDGGRLGLAQLSEALQVQVAVSGKAAHHQAGYDSLLTAMVFEAMMERFHLPEDALEGVVCGIEQQRIVPRKMEEELEEDAKAAGDSLSLMGRFHLSTATMMPPAITICRAHHRPPLHHHGAWFVGFPVPVLPAIPPAMLLSPSPPPLPPPPPLSGYNNIVPAGGVNLFFY